MNKHIKAPAENKEIDWLNPVEVAGIGVKKSVEMLRWLLGRKQERMEGLNPSGAKEKEQLAVAKNSVNRRNLLAQEISFA